MSVILEFEMDSVNQWLSPPAVCALPPGSLQIWRTRLDACSDSLPRYCALLSPAEIVRADRFVFPRDRQRFIVSRATLRLLLGRYLRIDPHFVRIDEGPRGKPFAAGSDLGFELKFNLSHSQGLAVFAFARQKEVGIDVEKVRSDFASQEIAQRYFSPEEIRKLAALAPERYTLGFFRCWTRKEAYIKARGQGLQIPLDSFSVSLSEGCSPELLDSDSASWSMYSFEPFPEFDAAVVAEKFDWTLSFYEGSELL